MASDYQGTFDRIIAKAGIVAERYAAIVESKARSDARIEELEKELAERNKELEKLRLEVEYLRIAATIAPSRDQVEEARAKISNLVREIDRCIIDITD